MKLEVDFKKLQILKQNMRAPDVFWEPSKTALSPRTELRVQLEEGIELSLEDVDRGPGGLLIYKGEQVVLYIKDTQADRYTLENEPEKSKRFHVAECETLENMRHKGRFERYVATIRMDGLFKVDWLDKETGSRGETDAALKVCKNCLKAVNWRGYDRSKDRAETNSGKGETKTQIWEEFEIDQFLREFSTFFHTKPSRRDTTSELNEYVTNWADISKRTRLAKKWTCEKCGVNLKSAQNLLHCHHKSGVVTDNSPLNLEVLCALDHAAQPNHGHMKVSAKDRSTIIGLRLEQGLPPD